MRKISAVRNPLTIIAIFAGLAEVAGTVVLPFVTEPNQLTYIWFLIVFPILLVLLFFLTLNYNPKVLYAPSDFRDESNYMKILRPSTTIDKLVKLENDIQESIDESLTLVNNTTDYDSLTRTESTKSTQNDLLKRLSRDPRSRVILAESLITDRLSSELKMQDQHKVLYRDYYIGGYLFDLVVRGKRGLVIVEIKYLSERADSSRLRETLHKIDQVLINFQDSFLLRNARVILALAHELGPDRADSIHNEINSMLDSYSVPVDIRMFNITDLIDQAELKL